MEHPAAGADSRSSLAALVAAALVVTDVPDAQPAELAEVARFVDESIAAMPDVTRAGVRFASTVVYVALSLLGGSPYRRQSDTRRSRTAGRLSAVSLPIVGEFGRLTRGLGLVSVYEQRFRNGSLG